jgi:hypothetical protein
MRNTVVLITMLSVLTVVGLTYIVERIDGVW